MEAMEDRRYALPHPSSSFLTLSSPFLILSCPSLNCLPDTRFPTLRCPALRDLTIVQTIRIAPGGALRLKSTLPQIGTPTAKLSGRLLARFGEGAASADVTLDHTEVFRVVGEEEEDSEQGGQEQDEAKMREITIAPLACSIDGAPVPAYTPLGFLQPALG